MDVLVHSTADRSNPTVIREQHQFLTAQLRVKYVRCLHMSSLSGMAALGQFLPEAVARLRASFS